MKKILSESIICILLCVCFRNTGCKFELDSEFICGGTQNPPVYRLDTSRCCAQFISLDQATQECCYEGVMDKVNGFCGQYPSDGSMDTSCLYDPPKQKKLEVLNCSVKFCKTILI